MITPSDRDELHPVCLARGIAYSQQTGEYVLGHDYEMIDGNNASDAVLKCQVCGWVSGPDFEGYVQ